MDRQGLSSCLGREYIGFQYSLPSVPEPLRTHALGALREGKLFHTDESLYNFFFQQIPQNICDRIKETLNLGGTQLELFLQPEVLNVFNEDAVIAGNTTVYDATNRPSTYAAFNPFTETPVEGVNWEKGPNFGTPRNAADYQQPRTVRFSVGLRF